MTTVAAIPRRSSVAVAAGAVAALMRAAVHVIGHRRKTRRDRRTLQTMPDYMLADIGLQKLEFRSSSDGRSGVWVIPSRYS